MKVSYEVVMTRPDRTRKVRRVLFTVAPIAAVSLRQLAGYLTHTLFDDTERGGPNTFYTVTERSGDRLTVFTVERNELGYYVRS